jgi:polysaccharide export outer membrane protein
MLSKIFWLLIVVSAAYSGRLAAQSAESNADHTAAQPAAVAGNSGRSDIPLVQERHPRYKVMPSDVLSISFPLSTELNQTSVTVQPDGYISLANVGTVYVQGQTIPEVIETLKKAYAKILHDPIIAVDVTNFQHPQFVVSGQVGKPGQYDLRTNTTVMEAIAIGGGFLPAAKSQVFLFRRVSLDWMEVKKLDIKTLLKGKKLDEDVQLQPGDMIFVPEKFITRFKQYVPYAFGIGINPSAVLFQ